MSERLVIAIPARYGSTRLPGKPLLTIAGKPLVAHVVERARMLSGAEIVVATDDARIATVATALGVHAVITHESHPTGSDRLAEVADQLGWPDETIVVNLQGDEPLMPVSCLQAVVDALHEDPGAAAATLATPVHSVEEAFDPACVKVVCDVHGRALYFSRAAIPWARDTWHQERNILPCPPPLRHLGVYAYRARTLRAFAGLAQGRHERSESLEQLRLLENRLQIAVRMAPEAIPPGVDTPSDLERVSRLLGAGSTRNPLKRVMFVCMGNICRSPLAEAYARKRFAELGLAIGIASAGTIGHHEGEPADAGAMAIAVGAGLDLSSHRARRVRDDDLANSDLILALDDRNLHDLLARAPAHSHKLKRLLDFAPACGHRDVPDPYGESQAVFAHSLELIRMGIDGLAAHLSASR